MDESRELFQRASQGDAGAVESLLELHLPRLRAFVRLRMGKALSAKESASDIVQSSCREVLENAGKFRYQGESGFRLWLYTTALRKIRHRGEYYRAAKRDVGREAAPGSADESGNDARAAWYRTLSTPSRTLAIREQAERIEAAFERLPDHYREVITLSRIVGLSRAEIAEVTGRTEASVRNVLHRALAELAELLDED